MGGIYVSLADKLQQGAPGSPSIPLDLGAIAANAAAMLVLATIWLRARRLG